MRGSTKLNRCIRCDATTMRKNCVCALCQRELDDKAKAKADKERASVKAIHPDTASALALEAMRVAVAMEGFRTLRRR